MTAYIELTQLKEYMQVTRPTDVDDDEWLQLALDSAHAGINESIRRELVVADTASVRRFTPVRGWPVLRIDDCATVTHINGDPIVTTSYQLEPLNSRSASGQYRPYTQIRTLTGWVGDTFGTVSITATWGWTTIPAQAYTACLILAKDIALNKDISFGLAALTDYAGIRARENPEVWREIWNLQRAESLLMG